MLDYRMKKLQFVKSDVNVDILSLKLLELVVVIARDMELNISYSLPFSPCSLVL